MREAETLAELASELRALPGRQRQAILNSLSAPERSRMIALLNRPAPAPDLVAAPAEKRVEGLSPWLAARAEQAAAPASEMRWKLTPATRQLLAKTIEELAQGQVSLRTPPSAPAKGKTLLGALGGMLSQRRALP